MRAEIFIALAGNPNSGKTTAFNKYTGAHQHVGNYPGITVEKKTGSCYAGDKWVSIIDLPGTYSLTAYSPEEVVARQVLSEERPGAVIDVLNSGALERNLYLAVQLREMGMPIVLALNMMDEARNQGIHIDIQKLEQLFGVRAIPTVARTGEGLDECLEVATELVEANKDKPWQPLHISYGSDIDGALNEIIPIIEENNLITDIYPARWTALKYIENDSEIHKKLKSAAPEIEAQLANELEKLSRHLKTTLNSYPEAIIAEYRYGYIASLLKQGVISGHLDLKTRMAYSDKIDTILTHKILGPLILIGVLYIMYFMTFAVGAYPEEWLGSVIGWIRDIVDLAMPESQLKSLILSGIIDGVGGVLGFVPLIFIMFILISVLEDSGYMARAAYMLDRVFRYFKLHGASVMPFIVSGGIAGGCAVPGVMAARTLRSPKERLATILTAPFMACGAKLPLFLLFVGIFFQSHQAEVMVLLSLGGWVAALLVAKLLRSTLIRGEGTPFVMELPPYRRPTFSGVLIHSWERIWMYIKKAGTIILAISVLLWAAMNYPQIPEENLAEFSTQKKVYEEELGKSILGQLNIQLEKTDSDDEKADIHQKIAALPISFLSEKLSAVEDELENTKDTTYIEKLKQQLSQVEKQLSEIPEYLLQNKIAEANNNMGAEALRYSIAGRTGFAFEGVSKYAGFDWKTNIALLSGIAAKELVVSTLGTAYSLGDIDPEGDKTIAARIASDPSWNIANATALLLFTLLYSPCFVTVVTIRQETGSTGWAVFSVVFNMLLAFTVAVIAYQLILPMVAS